MMIRVVLESPHEGDVAEVEAHEVYARACMADSLQRGEAPIASHLLYTQPGILDDTKPHEREKGMAAGLIWGKTAEKAVFYIDNGFSRGMRMAFNFYEDAGVETVYRLLGEKDA